MGNWSVVLCPFMTNQLPITNYQLPKLMKFTDSLWDAIAPIYSQILHHPFVLGLTDGTLDEAAFRFYAIQDALYLQDFARGLAILAAKSDSDDDFLMFCDHAQNAILVERSLHDSFFKTWQLTSEQVYNTPPAPNCLLYTSYLKQIALGRPDYEGLGAFLPCYWIYWQVGKELVQKGSVNPLYQQWIDTYASDEFEAVVKAVLNVTDRVAEKLTNPQKDAVKQHFIMTSKMEYLFWDMGYRQQQWEV
jgi:thiaminase (transcriptional activator TenA)